LACQQVNEIAIDQDGNKWMGCVGGDPYGNVSVLLTSGKWITYDSSNSGLVNCQGDVISFDSSNNIWFGGTSICQLTGSPSYQGVTKLAPDGSWTNYNTTNSGLVDEHIRAIAQDVNGNMWFGSVGFGMSVLTPSGEWITYDPSNSALVGDMIVDMLLDAQGQLWILAQSGLNIVSPEGNWETLLTGNCIFDAAIQKDGNAWLSASNGVDPYQLGLLHRNGGYVVSDNSKWLDALHWQATVDINSLVVRDEYVITVSDAKGSDGLKIAPDRRFGLVVDYAGEITDRTPPPLPFVMAAGVEGDASTVQARWSSSDPESTITGYRYSIGSAPGATDIVNWTPISSSSLVRSGLGLVEGQRYWFAVQARNEGGLWSTAGDSSFIAGRPFLKLYMPLIYKRW
jgi:hypothetical protein